MEGRRLVPELLDALSPDDPAARGSRRDLARINALMGNARVVARLLAGRPTVRLLEIGAGDGRFMRALARRLPERDPAREVVLLDRLPLVTFERRESFRALGWGCAGVAADVFDYLGDPAVGPFDAIVANLFLHHFEGDSLAELLRLVSAKTGVFVACEPARSGVARAGTRLLGAIGCNAVTRHDARASVDAGFRGAEIGAAWPRGWTLTERAALPFGHAFRAVRAR